MLLIILFVPVFLWSVHQSKLNRFDTTKSLIWIALTLFVFVLMLLSRSIPAELMLQYSGAAFLVLTLGYARALFTLSILLIISEPFLTLGVKLWCAAVVPVLCSWFVIYLSRRFLPANPFVFLFGPGFIGLFIVYTVSASVCSFMTAWQNASLLVAGSLGDALVWQILLAAGEAILEGMIITILTVYYPKAVALFDDELYLSRPM